MTDNPDLEAEGQDEELSGTVQKKVGQIKKVFEKSLFVNASRKA
jgi:uncharacterized protein YjbJ (UPF0337 family)